MRLINTTPYVPHNIILRGFSSIFNLEEIPQKRKNSKNLINDFWFLQGWRFLFLMVSPFFVIVPAQAVEIWMALQSYVTFFCSFEKALKIFLWSLLHTSLRLVNVLARARSGEKQRDHLFCAYCLWTFIRHAFSRHKTF